MCMKKLTKVYTIESKITKLTKHTILHKTQDGSVGRNQFREIFLVPTEHLLNPELFHLTIS